VRGRFYGRPCPRRLIVGQLGALQRNCAVHHLSPSPVRERPPLKRSRMRQRCVCRRQNASSADAEGKRAPPTTQGLGLYSTSHLVEQQHRNSVGVAGFLGCCHATRSATTPWGRNAARGTREGAAPRGWGDHSRHRSPFGLGPTGQPGPILQADRPRCANSCTDYGGRSRGKANSGGLRTALVELIY
jgi:hypothetical protein